MRNVIALFYFVGSENPCIYSVPNRKQSYENCDGQSVESLCELLFDQCIDKDQLDKRTVYEGCTKALETLLKMELLTIK